MRYKVVLSFKSGGRTRDELPGGSWCLNRWMKVMLVFIINHSVKAN